MSRPEVRPQTPSPPRYGWFVGAVAIVLVVLISINTLLTAPNGGAGIAPGKRMPPFAVPLALGTLNGDADIATGPDQGAAGRVAACSERGPQILNVCQLWERGPVVLALFVAGGSCPGILDDLQRLAPSFPGVQFAGVAIKGDRASLRRLVLAHGWNLPIGYDRDGALADLYKDSSCPQVTFAYPGGRVQQKALLIRPPLAALRARLTALVDAARARPSRTPA
jgi:hypothetical protein